MPTFPKLRLAKDSDSTALTELISSVYAEYGETPDFNDGDADLRNVASYYQDKGGAIIVLENEREVLGCHAYLPDCRFDKVATFKRIYLKKGARRQGLGSQLMNWAIERAESENMKRVEFWSDTRFSAAHLFFTWHKFIKTPIIRTMFDGSCPYQEYFFYRNL